MSMQSMAPTPGIRKLPRPSQRGKKERSTDNANQQRLRHVHASVRSVLEQTSTVVSLVSTPQDCLQLLQRIFRAEFPHETRQVCLQVMLPASDAPSDTGVAEHTHVNRQAPVVI